MKCAATVEVVTMAKPSYRAAAWWWDAGVVAVLSFVAGVSSALAGAPGGVPVAFVCLGIAYVLAKASSRREFKRGWYRAYASLADAGVPPSGRLADAPEPWDPFVASPAVSGTRGRPAGRD